MLAKAKDNLGILLDPSSWLGLRLQMVSFTFRHNLPLQIVCFSLILFYWFLLTIPTLLLLPFSLATFLLISKIFNFLSHNPIDKKVLAGVTGLTILFCLMLPINQLTDLDLLYSLLAFPQNPVWLNRSINLIENFSVSGLTFFLVTLLLYSSWLFLRSCINRDKLTGPQSAQFVLRVFLYALPCLLIWGLFLGVNWPGILSPDSIDQWNQAHTFANLNDWHPVGHTLLIFLLTRVWDSPAMVSIFQIVSLALLWGWVLSYLESQGLPQQLLLVFSWVFALVPYNGIMLNILWKDIPYTIASLLLVFLLGRIWYSQGTWIKPFRHQIVFALALASPYLLRHNGLALLILIPPILLWTHFKFWKPVLLAGVLAVILVFSVRNGIAFGLLKAQPVTDALQYTIPLQHIGAVISNDGKMSADQKQLAERLLPLSLWKTAYDPYNADNLSKPWGTVQDNAILWKISQNKSELLRLFFDLTIQNPSIVWRSELALNSIQWRILDPSGKKRVIQSNLFPFQTGVIGDIKIFNSQVIPNINKNTPLAKILRDYLKESTQNNLSAILFWRGGLYLFLTVCLAVFMILERGWRSVILFIPILANVLSLAIAMTVQDFRYIYPDVLPVFLLALFCLLPK